MLSIDQCYTHLSSGWPFYTEHHNPLMSWVASHSSQCNVKQ